MVCYVFSLKLPHRGNSNEYTQYTIFNTKKENYLNYPKSTAMGFFFSSKGLNSYGKRAISVRAIEDLLYFLSSFRKLGYYIDSWRDFQHIQFFTFRKFGRQSTKVKRKIFINLISRMKKKTKKKKKRYVLALKRWCECNILIS